MTARRCLYSSQLLLLTAGAPQVLKLRRDVSTAVDHYSASFEKRMSSASWSTKRYIPLECIHVTLKFYFEGANVVSDSIM